MVLVRVRETRAAESEQRTRVRDDKDGMMGPTAGREVAQVTQVRDSSMAETKPRAVAQSPRA